MHMRLFLFDPPFLLTLRTGRGSFMGRRSGGGGEEGLFGMGERKEEEGKQGKDMAVMS